MRYENADAQRSKRCDSHSYLMFIVVSIVAQKSKAGVPADCIALTAEIVAEVQTYDPETHVLTVKVESCTRPELNVHAVEQFLIDNDTYIKNQDKDSALKPESSVLIQVRWVGNSNPPACPFPVSTIASIPRQTNPGAK